MCLQAQCILFRRYPEVLEPFKYAGYPMLLQAVALPLQEQGEGPAAHFLGPEQAPRLQVCCVHSVSKKATKTHQEQQRLQVCCVADLVHTGTQHSGEAVQLCHDFHNSRQCIGQNAACILH